MNASKFFLLILFSIFVVACQNNKNVKTPEPDKQQDPFKTYMESAENSINEEFEGIKADSSIQMGLFSIEKTGVSTEPLKLAAEQFLKALSNAQISKVQFAMDSKEWRKWSNIHRYPREGIGLKDMDSTQIKAVFNLLEVSFSVKGFEQIRDIMRLNETLAEITKNDEEYGEDLYFFTFMGSPSLQEPWGWQLDGHHLAVNYFVLGDQIVVTPSFMGSEPVLAKSGKYQGTRVFEDEEILAVDFVNSLNTEQKEQMIISKELPKEVFTTSFRDNYELRYEGLNYNSLDKKQKEKLKLLIESYINNIRPGHSNIKMDEIETHFDKTYIAGMGNFSESGVFYYRIHSPVVLIEFDHQKGQAIKNDSITRDHIHSIVRTPNGNDYGKDLLRQHYEDHKH